MAAPPEIMDDVVEEILLRLPPDDPSCAVRASLVCKHWRHLLADAAFLRRYRAFHHRQVPPLLGFIYNVGSPFARFVPTTKFRPADLNHDDWRPIDCRHGRILFDSMSDSGEDEFTLWDPMSGDVQRLRLPDTLSVRTNVCTSAVLCAAAGCDHGDCHGGPFAVAFVSIDVREEEEITSAWLYSSETGTWSAPSIAHYDDAEPFPKPSVLAGDALYFLTWRDRNILRYDLPKLELTVIALPEIDDDGAIGMEDDLLMTTEDGGLGLARLLSGHSLHLWVRKPPPPPPAAATATATTAAAAWVQLRVIDLDLVLPSNAMGRSLLGLVEGTDIVFVDTCDGVHQIELRTLKVRKVLDKCYTFGLLPYTSFFLPGLQKDKLPQSAITQ